MAWEPIGKRKPPRSRRQSLIRMPDDPLIVLLRKGQSVQSVHDTFPQGLQASFLGTPQGQKMQALFDCRAIGNIMRLMCREKSLCQRRSVQHIPFAFDIHSQIRVFRRAKQAGFT